MYIEVHLALENKGKKAFINTEEIAFVIEEKQLKPEIFSGSAIGFKNGHALVVRQKPDQVMAMMATAKVDDVFIATGSKPPLAPDIKQDEKKKAS